MYLVKLKNGQFIPYDASDQEQAAKVPVGGVVKATRPRNYEFHKKTMALLNMGFENQDEFESFEHYRKTVTMRAGYYFTNKRKDGLLNYNAESLSYENMSSSTFDQFYKDVLTVISDQLKTAPEKIQQELNGYY